LNLCTESAEEPFLVQRDTRANCFSGWGRTKFLCGCRPQRGLRASVVNEVNATGRQALAAADTERRLARLRRSSRRWLGGTRSAPWRLGKDWRWALPGQLLRISVWMSCSENSGLLLHYEAALRRWALAELASNKNESDPSWRLSAGIRKKALDERDAARERLNLHERTCPTCIHNHHNPHLLSEPPLTSRTASASASGKLRPRQSPSLFQHLHGFCARPGPRSSRRFGLTDGPGVRIKTNLIGGCISIFRLT
jgi:hypothetical protein